MKRYNTIYLMFYVFYICLQLNISSKQPFKSPEMKIFSSRSVRDWMLCRKKEDILYLSILIFLDCCNRLPLIFGVPLSQQSVQLFAIFFKQLIKFLFVFVFVSHLLYFTFPFSIVTKHCIAMLIVGSAPEKGETRGTNCHD